MISQKNKRTKEQKNKRTKEQNNKRTKEQKNKTTKQQNNKTMQDPKMAINLFSSGKTKTKSNENSIFSAGLNDDDL